jgi:putative membrane protein
MKTLIYTLLGCLIAFAITAQDIQAAGTDATATTATTMEATTTATSTEAAPAALSDGEGAEVLVTLNEGEIELGQMAKGKARNKQVKDYAKMMVDQHKDNEKETKKIVRKQDLKFKKTDMSKSLKAEAMDSEKTLEKTSIDDFDQAYMNQQITMHEKALDTVNSLISAAKNPAYKAHLEKTRNSITTHLAHAKEIKSKLE